MNRRGFLSVFGGVAAAVTIAGAGASACGDDFTHRGWRVKWRGWTPIANQHATVGFWIAFREDRNWMWYSTSLGTVGQARDLDVLDMTRHAGWPSAMEIDLGRGATWDQVKARARDALLEKL